MAERKEKDPVVENERQEETNVQNATPEATDNSKNDKKHHGHRKKEDKVQKELEEIKDKYLRLSAEFDNYRKRTLKEKMDLQKTAGKDLLEGFLPIMDDFERAIDALDSGSDIEALKDGVHLIYTKCQTYLTQNKVKEIDATGKEFDVDHHEAITKIPAPEESLKGKVVNVVQKGYMIDDKVLRFAKVVVGD